MQREEPLLQHRCREEVREADIVFVSVNTPTKTQGLGVGKAADLTYWESAARMIADVSESDKIVVEKSTVPVKTAEAIEKILTHNSKGMPCLTFVHCIHHFLRFLIILFGFCQSMCHAISVP